jgi:hypothetical protein
MKFHTGFRVWLLWAACLLMVGCGDVRPVPVRGTVTVGGKILPYGSIAFQPADPQQGRSALAFIQPDGSYEATTFETGDGLLPGEYRLAIDGSPPPFDISPVDTRGPPLPKRYESGLTSGLTVMVSPKDDPKRLDLELAER